MQYRSYTCIAVLFLLLVSMLLPHTGVAKSYTIPEIRIEVDVQDFQLPPYGNPIGPRTSGTFYH